MSIWVVASRKRGSGKTTIAIHLTKSLRALGSVMLIDANLEGHDYEWVNPSDKLFSFEHLDVEKQDGHSLDHRLEMVKQHYDHIIVDIDGQDTPALRSVLKHANKLIIPSSIDPEDIQLETQLVQLAISISHYNGQLKVYTVLNKLPEQHQLSELIQTQDLLKNMPGTQFLNTVIYENEAYQNMLLNGKSIWEDQSDFGHNFQKMIQELMELPPSAQPAV